LVQEGTNDLKNVVVLPSGQFMISSSTLPGYFKKEELAERKLDASTDLLIFAQIAEQLGITKRFAGEEPIDQFTRQYNENMARVLPKYGIAFVEIPRKENDARVISASWVREALKTQNWSEIANLVPPSTYQYLQGKWRPK
jgi:citrate lyase synthetase